MRIKDVECGVRWFNLNGKWARLFIPEKVREIDFFDFAVSHFAENSSSYEEDAFDAKTCIKLYYVRCYRYLLHKRSFDLLSLSSPFYPTLRNLGRSARIKPTGDVLLDNFQMLVQLGQPDAPINLEKIMQRAIYRYPEWIPLENEDKDIDTLVDWGLKKWNRLSSQKMKETNASLEEILREIVERYMTLVLFMAERVTFEVLHQGGKAIYDMIKNRLNSIETALFKAHFLKNPNVLNRVVFFDPSPIVGSWMRMMVQIGGQTGVKKAFSILAPERIPIIWPSYLNFYPSWLDYVLEDEQEKRDRRRKEVSYEPWSVIYAKQNPDYAIDAPRPGLSKSNWAYDEEWWKQPGRPGANEKRRVKTFLSPLEQKVLDLEDEGLANKTIAQMLGYNPSYVSKVRKRTCQISRNAWRKGVYKPFLWSGYRRTRRLYDQLPSDARPQFEEHFTSAVRGLIRRFCKNNQFDPEQLGKELIPPFLRR